jgi:hypothetical protein
MQEKSVFWSLVPLILIIVLPWLFGFIGTRRKRAQQEREDGMQTEYRAEGTPDAEQYYEGEDDDTEWLFASEEDRPDQTQPGTEHLALEQREVSRYYEVPAPRISPEPIKPKWWGA